MNRELKFRAWHKELEDMTYSNNENHWYSKVFVNYPEFYKVMQSTDLTDKNGTIIYEGDYLVNPSGTKGVVIYHGGSFRLKLRKANTSWHYLVLNAGLCKNKTIESNICEHPELLK